MSATTREVVQIGFVTGDGGDAMQMMELSAGLIRKGWRTRIVVPRMATTAAFAERCRDQQIPVEQTDWVRANIHGAQQSAVNLARLLGSYQNAIFHLHTGDVCLARRALFALGIMRPRYVFTTIHSPYDHMGSGRLRARMWSAAVQLLLRKVICPSRHGMEAQLRYGVPPDRAQVIYNCVDVKRFGSGDPEHARRALGLAPESRLIVFSARMDGQKRPLDALQAYLNIEQEFPDVHLILVGQGSDEQALRARAAGSAAAGRIHFVGFQRNIPDWLASADVWILPTESENFSLAVLEALAAGCAIISTRCQGNDEVFVDCQNALLTEVGDIAGQTRALRRLLSDEDLRIRLKAEARRTAALYASDRMVEQVIECYESALADR